MNRKYLQKLLLVFIGITLAALLILTCLVDFFMLVFLMPLQAMCKLTEQTRNAIEPAMNGIDRKLDKLDDTQRTQS